MATRAELVEALEKELVDLDARSLEDVGNYIIGFVISPSFAGLRYPESRDLIKAAFRKHLPDTDFSNVGPVAGMAPEALELSPDDWRDEDGPVATREQVVEALEKGLIDPVTDQIGTTPDGSVMGTVTSRSFEDLDIPERLELIDKALKSYFKEGEPRNLGPIVALTPWESEMKAADIY